MAFKGLEKFMKKKEREFMQHVKPWVIGRLEKGTPITIEEFNTFYINSYERKYLFPLFDDNLLLYLIDYSLGQEGKSELGKYDLPEHYTDSVLRQYLPELIRRFNNRKGD